MQRLNSKISFFFKKRPRLKIFLRFLAIPFILLIIIYFTIPLPDPLFENDYSTVITDENNQILRAFLNKNQQWHFPPQNRLPLPDKLKTAILLFEDKHFYRHPGINPVSLLRATFQNIKAGKIKSGASTISMQVIRLAFKRKRTFINKCTECLQALKLEIKFSKREILKMYVDHAPYGGNIIGFHTAAMKYFNRPPNQLTWSQAATLAVLPNAPGLISPLMNRKFLIKKRNKLLNLLLKENIIDHNTCASSIKEPVPHKAGTFFRNAPHLARALKSHPHLNSKFLRTSIIKKHQVRIEELVKNHLNYLASIGIKNGAAIIAETGSGKIRAYAGSQDFFDSAGSGQVDGVLAPRSSGSILKPFLYALAIDDGLILPSTVIRDIPSYFGSFSPSNYDKKYNGLVSSKEALIRSLNVPAIRLLNAFGFYKFYIFLKSAGVTSLFRQPDDYGLTMVLGGAETSLYDMAVLYRGLGNQGRFAPLSLLYSDNGDSHQEPGIISGMPRLNCPDIPERDPVSKLLSPAACWLTLGVLKELKRPGAEFYWEQYRNQFPLAWKTGTSYGQRDAWAVGVNPSWTIAVWVGNFDGEGNTNLTGAGCAAPLMFDIFNYLPKSRDKKGWFDRPVNLLKPIELCMDTGFAAGPDCERTFIDDSPVVKHPLKRCPFHKGIYVTLDESEQVCSLCWTPGKYKKVSRAVYPPDVTQYLRESGVVVSLLPPHKKGCPGSQEEKVIQIVYPAANARLKIPRDFNGLLQRITFSAAHRVPGRKVFWYLDNIYRGVTQGKHKMAFHISEGNHVLEVVDEEGNRVKQRFRIL